MSVRAPVAFGNPPRHVPKMYRFHQRDLRAWITMVVICALVTAVPPLLGGFALYLGCVIACYAIATIGLQLMVGVAGQLSLGHAAFMAVGSYVTVLSQMRFGLGFVPATVLGVAASAVMGLLMAQLIRLSGIYFKIATFGFGVIVYQLISNWSSITGGHTGLTQIPPADLLGWPIESRGGLFALLAVALIVTYALALRTIQGRAGRALAAIGQNEPAALSIGVNGPGYKMSVIVLGCSMAGLGGAFMPQLNGFINPESFTWLESLLLLIMITVGGLGSIAGAVIGTALLVVVPEYLRDFAEYKMLIFGVLLVASLALMPRGLAGVAEAAMARWSPIRL